MLGGLSRPIGRLQGCFRGSIGTINGGIQVLHNDFAIGIEIHHQATQIGIFRVRGDNQRGFAIQASGNDRVSILNEIGGVTIEAHGGIRCVSHPFVATPGNHDINAGNQGSQEFITIDGVELIHHDNFIDTQSGEGIYRRLDISCNFL